MIRVYFWQGIGLWHSNCNPPSSCINLVQVQFIHKNEEETCVTYTRENIQNYRLELSNNRVVPDEETLKSCTLQCFYPIMSSYNHVYNTCFVL